MAKLIEKSLTSELAEFSAKLVSKVASDMVEQAAKVKKGDHVMVIYDIGGRQLAKEISRLCAEKGCRVWYRVRDMDLDSVILPNSGDRDISRYYSHINNEISQADVVFMIRALRDPEIMKGVPSDKMALYSQAMKPIYLDYRVNYTNWQLVYWPTPSEAEIEGISLEEYVELFAKASDQPWDKIEEAQKILCEMLGKARQLILIADPNNPDVSKRTYLEMSIEGMGFINSTIDNNYPGSEVFSSPVRDSVDGQLFAPGKKLLGHDAKIVEDVYFKVENGKIIEAKASKGQQELNEFLDRDEGARFFGEVALGTNPGIRRNVFNPLLNEKVGGSFHITPGKAYEDREENGNVVHIDNGNRSSIHWDLTIMMLPEYGGGEVIIDGRSIQKDGKFLVEGLEVLNGKNL